jgi:hypothetical protein
MDINLSDAHGVSTHQLSHDQIASPSQLEKPEAHVISGDDKSLPDGPANNWPPHSL